MLVSIPYLHSLLESGTATSDMRAAGHYLSSYRKPNVSEVFDVSAQLDMCRDRCGLIPVRKEQEQLFNAGPVQPTGFSSYRT
ncbi:hypothetical protein J6590_011224 [Homalodisca vitripennis]|nr:hypothetical protein J6590_011224 [Homalodisca vitripennis]